MQWYYAIDGQQAGPVDPELLFALARDGRLKASDLVWNETMGNTWARADSIPGLLQPPPVPPPFEAQAWHPSAEFSSRTPNRDLMTAARQSLTNNWGPAIGVTAIIAAISLLLGIIPFIGPPASWIVGGPLALGQAIVFLGLARGTPAQVGVMFDGFKDFGRSIAVYFLVAIFTFLWMLLLIVPGIIAALSYSMAYYILRDNPDAGPLEAIRRSKQMMRGNKWKFFCLCWRFFGWALLCILTCGIGFLFLMPYMATSYAHFYEDLRKGAS